MWRAFSEENILLVRIDDIAIPHDVIPNQYTSLSKYEILYSLPKFLVYDMLSSHTLSSPNKVMRPLVLSNNLSCIGDFGGNCFEKGDTSIGLILCIKSMRLNYYYILIMFNMSWIKHSKSV